MIQSNFIDLSFTKNLNLSSSFFQLKSTQFWW